MTRHSDLTSLNRRRFLAASSALTLSHLARQADTSEAPQDLSRHLHAHVRICRGELARHENAFWDWDAAVRQTDSLHAFAERYFKDVPDGQCGNAPVFDFQEEISCAARPLMPFPQGMAGDCVRAWLQTREEALQLIDRGTARQHFQVPREHLFAFLDDGGAIDTLSVPREVVRLKIVLCRHQLNMGTSALAVATATDLLDIVQMVLRGDGYLIHFLVALAVHATSVEMVHAFTLDPGTSSETLGNMRCAMLQMGPTTDSLARTFRMETSCFMSHEVSRLADAVDLRALVDILVERNLAMGGLVDQERLLSVKRGMFQLFDGHPCPQGIGDQRQSGGAEGGRDAEREEEGPE